MDPKIFDEALKDYFEQQASRRPRSFYAYIEATPPTDENYAWAQYFLARSLIDLGLRHAGAVYLASRPRAHQPRGAAQGAGGAART